MVILWAEIRVQVLHGWVAAALVATSIPAQAQELTIPRTAIGDGVVAQKQAPKRGPGVVVVRISGKVVEEAVNRQFERSIPIRTQVLDAWCVGSGAARGSVSIDFASAELEEALPVRIAGTMFSRANGYSGRAVVTARTNSTYDALFNLKFDGKEFFGEPTSVRASCQSDVECVRATRRLGRRLVECIGPRVAVRQVPRYDFAASRLMEHELRAVIEDQMQPVLADLNRAVKFGETLNALAGLDGHQRSISKTGSYIQIRIAPGGLEQPTPTRHDLLPNALIEIWVHPRSSQTSLADLAVKWLGAQDAFRKLLPPETADAKKISVAVEGDWDMIKVEQLPLLPGVSP